MFLNEDKIMSTYDAAKADASFLSEAILEANEVYHDICMKMIKCEHYCIINENSKMLAEAEEEAKRSFKESAMALLKKIKEAIINFGKWLVEKLRQAFAWIAKIPANISGAIKGSLKKLKKAEADVDAINAANDPIELKFESTANYNEAAEVEEETVDAKTGTGIAKNIITKLKAATSKLNVFKRSAEKAATEGENPQENHKKLSAISSAISKAFARIRSAFSTAIRVIVNAFKAAGAAVANTAKKAKNAVASKMPKKGSKNTNGIEIASASILDQF